MSEPVTLTLADLLIDAQNPPLPVPSEGQREALADIKVGEELDGIHQGFGSVLVHALIIADACDESSK
jgi:hypothetical protein